MPEAKCILYDIVLPRSISRDAWTKVFVLMERSGWFGKLGSRYGAVTVAFQDDLLVGHFAHEGQKSGVQYDEEKRQITASNVMFEHLFFAIFSDTSQILLQHRNIYGYDDLGYPDMRRSFLTMLAQLLESVGIRVRSGIVKIEPAETTYTQQEMYEFFISNSVVELKVDHLNRELIPSTGEAGYNLYNPKEEWNAITWGAVDETLKVGTKNVVLQGNNDGATQLNKAPLAKAFARVGQIDEIRAQADEDRIIIRKRTESEEITISIPGSQSALADQMKVVLAAIDTESRQASWHHRLTQRQEDQLRGTMYDGGNQ